MRLKKLTALMLALCLMPFAIAEGQDIYSTEVEAAVAPADAVDGNTGLSVEGQDVALPETPADAADATGDALSAVAAPASDRRYARVRAKSPLYFDALSGEVIAELAKGEVVLVTGDCEGMAAVAVYPGSGVVEGYMNPADLAPLSEKKTAAYLADIAASGNVALYANDLDWPIGLLGEASRNGFSVMALYCTEYSNDRVFTINGKEVSANMVPDPGSGRCWTYARNMYDLIWGCKFNETFKGTAATGLNLLRELSDEERKLTPEHLKRFAQQTKPGATIRVCGCTTQCPQFDNDGLSCGHNGHSLIIAAVTDDGIITLDSHSNSQHTRFYSWDGFCQAWKNYGYVKYIKWPNAPALAPDNTIDGYAVTACSGTWRVRATAKSGAKVYSKPSGGKVLANLVYPATFTAVRKATKAIDGVTWIYGATEAGVSGWLPLNDAVAGADENIAVTAVALDHSKLLLLEGGSHALTAALAPADATDRKLAWSSSDNAIATVKNGVVSAVSSGVVMVTAATQDGAQSASCAVKVVPVQGSKDLKKTGSNGTVKLYLGQKLQLGASFATKKGWKLKSATSSKAKVAAIDNTGMVTSKAAGKATITVKTKNGRKATLTVQVIDPFTPTKVTLNKKRTLNMKKGATQKLYATLSPVTASSALTWKSTNEKVAIVDTEGNVTAKGKGSCYVGAITENGVYAKVKVKVS